MRLLNTKTLRLEIFIGNKIPNYAILSHTWEDEEVLFEDLDPAQNPTPGELFTTKKCRGKVLGCAKQARLDGYDYVWIDTCCINKSSSAELSEAINSMFKWYEKAGICYTYLADVKEPKVRNIHSNSDAGREIFFSAIKPSRWFSRGWTLQELIAPRYLVFYDRHWKRIADRHELAGSICAMTGIPEEILRSRSQSGNVQSKLQLIGVADRMGWAAKRQTTRIEDEAYCLMGIFDVNMPLLYGEGQKAFRRLQEEITKTTNDQTLLSFHHVMERFHYHPCLFSREPSLFCADYVPDMSLAPGKQQPLMNYTALGLELDVLLCSGQTISADGGVSKPDGQWLALLHCSHKSNSLVRPGIYLHAINVEQRHFYRPSWLSAPLEFRPEEGLTASYYQIANGASVKFKITSEITPARIIIQESWGVSGSWRKTSTLVKVETVLSGGLETQGYQTIEVPKQEAGYMCLENVPFPAKGMVNSLLCSVFIFKEVGPGWLEGFRVICGPAKRMDSEMTGEASEYLLCCIERRLISTYAGEVEEALSRGPSEVYQPPRAVDTWDYAGVSVRVSMSPESFLGRKYHKLLILMDRYSETKETRLPTAENEASSYVWKPLFE